MKLLPSLIMILTMGTATTFAQTKPEINGHRGCRGLMPENTIPAFLKAVDVGATYLELDVVISQDNQVVISHEAYMNYATCLDSTGNPIPKEKQTQYKIYGMTMDQIRKFDCGSLPYPSFPEQEKMKVTKPLFSEMIDAVESYVKQQDLKPVSYNIEIKCSPEGDNVFHPEPARMVDLVLAVLKDKGIEDRCFIQSFDVRPLQYLHSIQPDMRTGLLIQNVRTMKHNLKKLGYTPTYYNPYYMLVTRKLLKQLHKRRIQLYAWTVNKDKDIQKMMDLGVDGIITDYPHRVKAIVDQHLLL
ncbi:MAG: glycerophosphodiester phosphodiesterase family protein [Bacteroidota bacterium]